MKYMGSKARHAKEIYSAIVQFLGKEPVIWTEPFVGGANMIDKVPCSVKYGNDINEYLISLFRAVQQGYTPPDSVSEETYKAIQKQPECFPPELVAFVGIGCSYSGKWFGGYARGKDAKGRERNYCLESKTNLLAQDINGIVFTHGSYRDSVIPVGSVVYCDPPYAGTTKYKDTFNHAAFWGWCEDLVRSGFPVFVSEYVAPDGWECIWSKTVNNTLVRNTGSKQGIEKLFTKRIA